MRAVRAARVVEIDVGGDASARSADAVIGLEVDLLVFHTSPQSFDEDVGASSQLHRMGTLSDDLSG